MIFLKDLRFAARTMLKDIRFTSVAVIVLALGIGVNTTVFTLVNAVLFRALPFPDPYRVMYLAGNNLPRGEHQTGISYPDFLDWRAQTKSFAALGAFTGETMNLSDRTGVPERYVGTRMTANAFALVGQKPLLGRDFLPDEDRPGAARVVILGYGIWKDRYGGDAGILGKTVRINELPATIVGVMPEGMGFPDNAQLWVPLVPDAQLQKRDHRELSAFGRLIAGATLAEARAEMDTIARRLEKEYPASNQGVGVEVKGYNDSANGGPIRVMFLTMLGAVGFVLLIACANVANLMLSRALARTREMSIRTALGATRLRILRQLLTESVLLAGLGGFLGWLLAIWGVRLFDLAVANVGKPYWIHFTFDWTVFAYLAGVCLVTGILFGLAPALRAARLDLNQTLKEGGRGHSGGGRIKWFSGALVVVELALSVILLAGAGLMIRSFLQLNDMNRGLDARALLTMRLNLADAKYPGPEARQRFYDSLLARGKSIPGVQSLAVASNLPHGGAAGWQFEIEGQPAVDPSKRATVLGLVISPEYFDTLGLRLLRGRAFQDSDGLPGKSAVIVNQRFASKHWGGQDPLGKRLRLIHDDQPGPWLSVAGVAPDTRQNNPMEAAVDPVVYVPFRQDPIRSMALIARTGAAPTSVATAFRKEVQAIDQDLPLYNVRTLEQAFVEQRWPWRVFGTLFSIFATIALVMSAVGTYAVMAYAVSQRTQEIGVRLALGAGSRDILQLVMSRGLAQLGIGLGLGLAGAFGLTRVMSSLLIQVSPSDPLTFAAITGIVLAAGIYACWHPARKALKVDPLVALRYE